MTKPRTSLGAINKIDDLTAVDDRDLSYLKLNIHHRYVKVHCEALRRKLNLSADKVVMAAGAIFNVESYGPLTEFVFVDRKDLTKGYHFSMWQLTLFAGLNDLGLYNGKKPDSGLKTKTIRLFLETIKSYKITFPGVKKKAAAKGFLKVTINEEDVNEQR